MPAKSKQMAIHKAKGSAWDAKLRHFVRSIDLREVRVMAVAEGYAMVRCKGAMPYVASVKELEMK